MDGKDAGALGGAIGSDNPAMMGCGCGTGGMNPMGGMCGMGPMCGGGMAGMPMGGGMMGKGGMPGSMPGNMPGNMPGAMGGGMGGMGTMMPNMMGNMGGTMGNGMMGMGGMNPMMAMMGMMMGMQAAMGSGETADATPTIKAEDKHVDARVKAICNDFGISGDTVMRLNDAMREREDYDEDLQALHKLMERATKDGKKPLEVMLAQIRAIRANRFPGKELLDPEVWEFICKYNLDDRVMNRLIDTLNNRKNKRKDTLQALNDRLGNAQQPTGLGLLVRLLEGLDETGPQLLQPSVRCGRSGDDLRTGRLPSPPRRLGGSGTFRGPVASEQRPTGTFLHPQASSREAREGREQERSRGRRSEKRSRSRSPRSRGRDSRRSRSGRRR